MSCRATPPARCSSASSRRQTSPATTGPTPTRAARPPGPGPEPPVSTAYGPPFASYQAEIFLRGLSGDVPEHPVALAELARLAAQAGDPEAIDYVAGGAGSEDTMRANEEAFRRWRIVPRMLRDVFARELATTVLGTRLPAPVGLAPVGVQTIVHPDGELATARAAAAVGL